MSLICAAILIACSRKAVPSNDANSASNTSHKTDGGAANPSSNTNTSATTIPSFNDMKGSKTNDPKAVNPLILDQGKTIYLSKCKECHALKNIHDYTTGQWNEILKKEIPRAKLGKNEGDQVTVFILAKANR